MSMSYADAKAALMRLYDLCAAPSPAGFRASVVSFERRGRSDYGRFLRRVWFA